MAAFCAGLASGGARLGWPPQQAVQSLLHSGQLLEFSDTALLAARLARVSAGLMSVCQENEGVYDEADLGGDGQVGGVGHPLGEDFSFSTYLKS